MSRPALLLQERHALILQQLQSEGRVLAPDLARQLGVSEDTVRRDLRDLAASGFCHKVYGGAVRAPSPADVGTLTERSLQQQDSKARLAVTAAGLIAAGSVVFIDAGSSNLSIAKALPAMPLTIITNAPAIVTELAERPDTELIMVGGRFDSRSGAMLGANALRDIARLRPDLYVMGACTVDVQAGIGCFNYEEAELKRQAAACSKATLVASTREKLGTGAPYHVLDADRLTYLVVPADAPVEHTGPFAALGVHILHAS